MERSILADDGGVLAFVGVRTRSGGAFGSPFEAIDRKKRDKIRKVALCYMKRIRKEPPARFDVLSIDVDGAQKRIDHTRDAFEV